MVGNLILADAGGGAEGAGGFDNPVSAPDLPQVASPDLPAPNIPRIAPSGFHHRES
jgi:hypothetical protein